MQKFHNPETASLLSQLPATHSLPFFSPPVYSPALHGYCMHCSHNVQFEFPATAAMTLLPTSTAFVCGASCQGKPFTSSEVKRASRARSDH